MRRISHAIPRTLAALPPDDANDALFSAARPAGGLSRPPRLRPPWLRIVLVVAIVWLGVALVHGVNFALTRVSGEAARVSDPQR